MFNYWYNVLRVEKLFLRGLEYVFIILDFFLLQYCISSIFQYKFIWLNLYYQYNRSKAQDKKFGLNLVYVPIISK